MKFGIGVRNKGVRNKEQDEVYNKALTRESIDSADKYVITQWSESPSMYLLRMMLNISEQHKINLFITRDLKKRFLNITQELLHHITNEELIKCKHKHNIKLPIDLSDTVDWNTTHCVLNNDTIVYKSEPNIIKKKYVFSGTDDIVTLVFIIDAEKESVIYSEILVEDLP
ncbi:MAG: hypothetical protein KAS32_01705 [Candidatus Peribacteraceae bacterium]|nr:hypothetical protein [Candidatus Peribacteraceae bacterium]